MTSLQTTWYWFIRNSVRYGYFVLCGGFRVSGAEKIPDTGSLIIAPNHESYLDPPAVACAMPRVVTFMAKEELFKFKIFGAMIGSVGAFPVKRGAGDIESIRIALSILEKGQALLIFPEGTRNYGEQMMPINRGVEMLAKKSGAHVVPTAIIGTDRKWGKGKKWKIFGGRVRVRFGEPMLYSDYTDKNAFAAELERRILELCHAEGFPLKSASDSQPSNTIDSGGEAIEPAHP